MHVPFVCSRNRLRSPTAEAVFAAWPGIEVASAGLSPDADTPLTPDLVEWSDLVFVMEPAHRNRLAQRFRPSLRHARVICLDIAATTISWIPLWCGCFGRASHVIWRQPNSAQGEHSAAGDWWE